MTKATDTPALPDRTGLGRSPISRGLAQSSNGAVIEPAGGKFEAGRIRGFAVITKGEALGHDMWIDDVFLAQVSEHLNAAAGGLKSRFTHPDMCSDGMGKYLGRAFESSVDGGVVRADLHLAKSAQATPDGNLSAYVMQLAAEDPEAFGTSIVFMHDSLAEEEFWNANLKEVEIEDYDGRVVKRLRFRSPDPENANHYYHARLAELRAVDVVDEPAANPTGMFRRGDEVVSAAESYLSYALGLSQEKPAAAALSVLGVEPERAQKFLAGFLGRHKLQLLSVKDEAMTTTTAPAAGAETQPAPPTREQFSAELKKFTTKFGAKGAEWFAEGKTWEQALEAHCDELSTQLGAGATEREELQKQITTLRGAAAPVSFNNAEKVPAAGAKPEGAPVSEGLSAWASKFPIPGNPPTSEGE